MYVIHQDKLDAFQRLLAKEGWGRVHVLADFDGTLTRVHDIQGKRLPSLLALLRQNGDYLGDDYAERANALHAKYGAIEKDHSLPIEYRKTMMLEWWMTHYALLKEKGLTIAHLKRALEAHALELKTGITEFIQQMQAYDVPVIILSASGIGELVPMYLESKKLLTPNVHIITNRMEFDEQGHFLHAKEPIIHSLNKDEMTVALLPEAHTAVQQRPHVLLLGDSPHDIEMVTGFEAASLLKVGFSNDSAAALPERFEEMKRVYDVVIEGDSAEELMTILRLTK